MSKNKTENLDEATQAAAAAEQAAAMAQPEVAAQPEPAPESETAPVSDPLVALQAELEAAQVEITRHKDAFLRAHAEAENTRKRAEREVANARKFALEAFVNELLGVCDSLELGLDAAGQGSADVGKLREGMELTHQQLLKVFEQHRIQVLNPLGEAFNPEHHQAISTQESAEHAPNSVMAVLQKGYRLNERVLRPAMVIVAKGVAAAADSSGKAADEDGSLEA